MALGSNNNRIESLFKKVWIFYRIIMIRPKASIIMLFVKGFFFLSKGFFPEYATKMTIGRDDHKIIMLLRLPLVRYHRITMAI